MKTDGIEGLYRGFSMQALGLMIQRGLNFGVYSLAKVSGWFDNDRVLLTFLAAMGISFFSEVITYPFAVIMKRMML